MARNRQAWNLAFVVGVSRVHGTINRSLGSHTVAITTGEPGESVMHTYLNQKDEEVRLPDEVAELTREHTSEVADAGELLTLASALALCPATERAIVVEIGTYRGGTACFIGRTLRALGRPMPVLSIDAFDLLGVEANNVQGDYAEYHNNVRKYGLEG
jgi:hypothetical protein